MQRVCFLHIGTHKTGTTSLQLFLTHNEPALRQHGILIPRNGRLQPGSGGHHNLPRELLGDGAVSAWPKVLGEIHSHELPTVCLSAEDFVHLHRRPGALTRIKEDLNSIGYEVKVVVYLRPQADCIESIYAELVKSGLAVSFREYFEEIIHRDARAEPEWWTYWFDYREILAPFARVFGQDSIVVRVYKANRRAKWLIKDFLAVISPERKIRGLKYKIARARHNPSANFAEVVERTLTNRCRDGSGGRPSAISRVAGRRFMRGRFDPLELRNLLTIRRWLHAANQDLYRQYRVKLPTMTSRLLLRELLCSAGFYRASLKRKALLATLEDSREASIAKDRS